MTTGTTTTSKKSANNIEEDSILAEAMMNGSKTERDQAFNILYAKYYSRVRFDILKKVKDESVIDDITQEVFIKVLKSIEYFGVTKGAFSTWLFTITRNTFIDYYRREKQRAGKANFTEIETIIHGTDGRNSDPDSGAFNFADSIPDNNKSLLPANKLLNKEISEKITEALDSKVKNEQFRRVFIMFFVDNLQYTEIAEQENISIGTVKGWLFRVKNIVAGYIRKNYPELGEF